jgi:hypothetical protein
LQVTEVFKPVKEVNPILQAVGADSAAYYSPQEVTALIFQYIQEQVSRPKTLNVKSKSRSK